ncbi:rab3 GTPase-activating protein catalytic subunit isoform X2 [Ricinus communis]|uniref:rab3 GTPase-activating protein catalytic subunit isoform X2 n=1 Tax=Ricinus communis TaxID=3988 RepID=UPI00201B1864|nr:rab3 GTPase-activating protein catalytic subunit isoform X2 [Ricinus communis]
MEAPSFVSKARTAFHSAAAKAERVFTDIKSDFISDRADSDKQSPRESRKHLEDESVKNEGESKSNNEGRHLKWRPSNIVTKQEWQDRFKNIRIGKRGGAENQSERVENPTMAAPFYDENLYLLNMKNDAEAKGSQVSFIAERLYATNPDNIPSTSVMKQLAIAIDAGKKHKSLKDLLASSGSSSPILERASLSLAAMKSLVLRDKEDKLASEFGGDDEKVLSLIHSLFDAEGKFLRRNINYGLEASSLPRDIHGSPPESLLVKISEVIGSFKTLRKMALLWCKIVAELRRLWSEELHIPGIPLDDLPDLNSCLLYQQFQVINCCVSRKQRHILATESLESVMRDASSVSKEPAISKENVSSSGILYARLCNGELVLRLGADHQADNLTMLGTGEPIYSPITQEGPLLTEDLIKENEEFVLRTGSVGAGCSQLLSDMQAFKAANPGCILEDFVRWHSPPDWTESGEVNEFFDGSDSSSTRGQLSSRMQKEGNLWRELWETSKAVPAVKQAPLYDEDLAVEGILHDLEDLPPSELFEQLFISLVYETVEKILLNPEEVLRAEETTTTAGEPRRLFKKLGLNFGSKDRNLRKPSSRDDNSEMSPGQPFSNFFDGKSSLFSKKPPRPETPSLGDKTSCPDDNEWTLV